MCIIWSQGGEVLILPINIIGCDRLLLPSCTELQFETRKCHLNVRDGLCLSKSDVHIAVGDNTTKNKQFTKKNKIMKFFSQYASVFHWYPFLCCFKQKRGRFIAGNIDKGVLIVVLEKT